MKEKALELLNQAQELLGKEPADDQFAAYPRYLKATDIAEILQVSRVKAQNIMHYPDFPLIKLGRNLRVEREQFFRWVHAHMNRGA